MNHVSIFEKKWLDLVFEGKNKSYGAYQLRQENPRTTLFALFLGLFLISAAVSIPVVLSLFKASAATTSDPVPALPPIHVTTVNTTPEQPKPPVSKVIPIQKESDVTEKKQLTDHPEIVKTGADDPATNKEKPTPPENQAGTGVPGINPTPGNPGEPATTPTATTETGEEPKGPLLSNMLDKLPMYPGGMDVFYKEVANKFRQPDLDEERTIKVYVSFVVEKDGTMTDIKVLRDPGYGAGTEALRVLKSMKEKWTPGIYHNQKVRTTYTLPITINIK